MLPLENKKRRNIRFRLLRIEGVDLTTSKHIRQHEILKDLDTLGRTRIVVIVE